MMVHKMNSSHTQTMINPFDGAILTATGADYGRSAGNECEKETAGEQRKQAHDEGAGDCGAKGMELVYRWKRDRRIAELEAQIETKAVTKADLNLTI